jgi:hypothetical protein
MTGLAVCTAGLAFVLAVVVWLRVADVSAQELATDSARLSNSAVETIGNNAATSLTFNVESFDDGGLHSLTTNTERMTAVVAGVYVVGAGCAFAPNVTGIRSIQLQVSRDGGSTWRISSAVNFNAVSDTSRASIVQAGTVVKLAVGDAVRVQVVQTSGGNLDCLSVSVSGDYQSPVFTMSRLVGLQSTPAPVSCGPTAGAGTPTPTPAGPNGRACMTYDQAGQMLNMNFIAVILLAGVWLAALLRFLK